MVHNEQSSVRCPGDHRMALSMQAGLLGSPSSHGLLPFCPLAERLCPDLRVQPELTSSVAADRRLNDQWLHLSSKTLTQGFRGYFGKNRGITPMPRPTSQSLAEVVLKQCVINAKCIMAATFASTSRRCPANGLFLFFFFFLVKSHKLCLTAGQAL